jgi:hypothetical protein
MKKLTLMACGLIVGGVAMLAVAGTGNAAAVPASGLPALPDYTADTSLTVPVGHRHYHAKRRHRHAHPRWRHRHRYDRRRHGRRYKHRRPRHRHYYRGDWYAYQWWFYSVPQRSYDPHRDWCFGRYRSYNPNTDMFLGYDGRYHRCRSPYRP